jgi:hypothetical protein
MSFNTPQILRKLFSTIIESDYTLSSFRPGTTAAMWLSNDNLLVNCNMLAVLCGCTSEMILELFKTLKFSIVDPSIDNQFWYLIPSNISGGCNRIVTHTDLHKNSSVDEIQILMRSHPSVRRRYAVKSSNKNYSPEDSPDASE